MARRTLTGEYAPVHPERYKGKYPIIYRSSWELRLMKFFDQNENIISWSSESLIVHYQDPIDNRIRRYFPDFVVIYRDKEGEVQREIIEVKPFYQTQEPQQTRRKSSGKYMHEMGIYIRNIKKWDACKAFAYKKGYKFRIITEKELF